VALSELERHVLSFNRGFDIPSETIPSRYFEFLRGGAAEPIAEIFRHNEMDLRGLAALAIRIARLLEDPERSGCGGAELFGISRMMQRRGQADRAGDCYERALNSGLPFAAERSARRELAYLSKRAGNQERANALWHDLLGDSRDGIEAYEQLAIYYEHHAREPRRAAALTREALVKLTEATRAGRLQAQQYRRWHARLQHRLTRLTAKS
jgi:tetratricopeptide (TPR) repeat protein